VECSTCGPSAIYGRRLPENMAAKIQGIPVYEARVEGEADGMVRISLVDDPAVMSNWQKFRATPPSVQMYSVTDEEKRIVRGVVMRADFPIYRRDIDKQGRPFEYYIIYHADTIREMAEKYLAENRANRVDTMHDGDEVEDVRLVQWFIKDTAAGVNPTGFDEDIADGSLFAEYHITNDEIWEQVKDGTFRGFSLEGYFSMRPEEGQESIDEIVDELAGQFHITNMSKIERLKEILRAALAEQEDVQTEVQAAEVEQTPEAAAEVKCGAVTTDRGPIEWDGEDDLKEGDRIYAIDEEGNRTNAEGEYTTEDGKVIVAVDGVVAEIRDPEAEVAPAQEEAAAEPEATEETEVQAEAQQPDEAAELRAALESANARIATLEAELEAARQMPMAQPAHEEVKAASARVAPTGNKGIDRLNALMGL